MIDWVIEAVDGKRLTLGEKAVLRKMLWLDREVDLGCYASAEYLGGLLGMTGRTVRRHRAALLEKGLLRKERETWFVQWPFDAFPPASIDITSRTPDTTKQWATALNDWLGTPRTEVVTAPRTELVPPRTEVVRGGGQKWYSLIYGNDTVVNTGKEIREGSSEPSVSLSVHEETEKEQQQQVSRR